MNHRKIAELAHVSTSTVSKALSGNKEISDELAGQIRQIAIDIGYFSEKNKRKFNNKRKKQAQIAVICPEIISIHYSRIITLLKSFIEERDGRIAVYIYDFNISKRDDYIESLSMDGITDGIIVFSALKYQKSFGIPVVCFDAFYPNGCYDSVGVDISEVLRDCIGYLTELGHKDIGFIGEPRTSRKEVCYRQAMQNAGLVVNEDFVYNMDDRFESIGREAAKLIISSQYRPSAFITAYDEIAVSLIYYLQEAGIKVPEHISVIGMNDIPLAPYSYTSLTTVRFFYDEQAALAVDILYDKIFGVSDEIHHLKVKHEMVIRNSTEVINTAKNNRDANLEANPKD